MLQKVAHDAVRIFHHRKNRVSPTSWEVATDAYKVVFTNSTMKVYLGLPLNKEVGVGTGIPECRQTWDSMLLPHGWGAEGKEGRVWRILPLTPHLRNLAELKQKWSWS